MMITAAERATRRQKARIERTRSATGLFLPAQQVDAIGRHDLLAPKPDQWD